MENWLLELMILYRRQRCGNETLTIAATAGATLDDATALAIALG
ncbi:MAG: hypothetical protein CM15mV66_300 [uncultured marine virus]|nr:MAG: hypothetical protein CM15mV66_300 [uncultured marine virus]